MLGFVTGKPVAQFQLERNLHLEAMFCIKSYNTFHCFAERASVVDKLDRLSITKGTEMSTALLASGTKATQLTLTSSITLTSAHVSILSIFCCTLSAIENSLFSLEREVSSAKYC